MRVSQKTFKNCFLILVTVFIGMFIVEFISLLMDNPISEIYIQGLDLERDTIGVKVLRSFISASFIGGICNFFVTVKVIKEFRDVSHISAPVAVIMTLLFPLELLISVVLVVPNLIIFGIRSLMKNKHFEGGFENSI